MTLPGVRTRGNLGLYVDVCPLVAFKEFKEF